MLNNYGKLITEDQASNTVLPVKTVQIFNIGKPDVVKVVYFIVNPFSLN